MWNHGKVKVNHAYKGELTDKDVAYHRGRHPQSLERLSSDAPCRGGNRSPPSTRPTVLRDPGLLPRSCHVSGTDVHNAVRGQGCRPGQAGVR